MNIDANQIKQLIVDSSNVVIMAHKNLDLDALGSSLGVYYIAKSLSKEAYLLMEDKTHELGVARSLRELKKQKIDINICSLNDIKDIINNQTLLIILDVSDKALVQNPDALSLIKSIILIDHHIADRSLIKDTQYKYINDKQSSTSEVLVTLLKELDVYIHPYIATIMLAGIFIDTNNFIQKTVDTTYIAAAYLKQQGAEHKELNYLLKEDLYRYNERQRIISEAEVIRDEIVIGIGLEDHIYHPEDLAKVSQTLLLFNNIQASFTIAKISETVIGISARSLENIDVQYIMEQLGGGGNESFAATQLENTSIKEARDKLLKIIYNIKL